VFGAVTYYGWFETDCANKKYRIDGVAGVTAQGLVVVFMGNEPIWSAVEENSPAANARVLLCDQP
jgi:hypothetical protein